MWISIISMQKKMIIGFTSGSLLINKLTEMMLASKQSPQISQMFNKTINETLNETMFWPLRGLF